MSGKSAAGCMVYVDLNSIRAGVAGTPEESDLRNRSPSLAYGLGIGMGDMLDSRHSSLPDMS